MIRGTGLRPFRGCRNGLIDSPRVDPDEWDMGMRINVRSVVPMTRSTVPAMRRSGGGSTPIQAAAAATVAGRDTTDHGDATHRMMPPNRGDVSR